MRVTTNPRPLRPNETSTIIRTQIEGLSPEGGLVRDLLIRHGLKKDRMAAVAYVQGLPTRADRILLEVLQKAESVEDAFTQFNAVATRNKQ